MLEQSKMGNSTVNLVYTLIDPITMEFMFVGKSMNGMITPELHLKPSVFYKGSSPCHKWLRKLYRKGLKPSICVIETTEDPKALKKLRDKWIKLYRASGDRTQLIDDRLIKTST